MAVGRYHRQQQPSTSSGGTTVDSAGSHASLDQPSPSSSFCFTSRPSVLRPFRSLTSLQSSVNTDEAFAAMEKTTLGPEPPPIDSPLMGQPPEGDVVPKTGPDRSQLNTDWRSLYVCAVLSFCSSVQYSLYFASMWQYFSILDKSATERFFGYIVAAYSLGQILGSPLVGYISNRLRKIRHLLYVGLLLMFTGNTFYLAVHLFPTCYRKFVLLFARFITGIGSSNISLLKAYASTASTQPDRSKAIAMVTGGVALGTMMGPAFQLLFTPFGYPGLRLFPDMHLSMYTAPAMLACAMNMINAMTIWTLFREIYAGLIQLDSQKSTPADLALPKSDWKAMFLCYMTRFTQMFIHTNLETLGAPLAMMLFAWTRDETVLYFSISQGLMAFLAFLTYVAFILFRLDTILNFRISLMLSLVALFLFHVITYSYPFLPGHVKMFSSNEPHNGTEEQVGCDTAKFSWCPTVRPLSPLYFYSCYILIIGLAFPNINVTLNTLFSKIVGPRRQGIQQGLLQMSGGMAKMVGPVMISTLYTLAGPQSAWLVEITVILITLALWFVLYRHMVPLAMPPSLLGGAQMEQKESTVSGSTSSRDSSSSSNSRRRRKQRSPEERRKLVEPIEEEPDETSSGGEKTDDEGREGRTRRRRTGEEEMMMERNNVTVSTVASLGDT